MTSTTAFPAPTHAVHTTPAAMAYQATKVYGRGDNEVRALNGVDVHFASSQFTAIMGPVRIRKVDLDALRGRPRHLDQWPGVHR